MHLALAGARANRRPAYEIANVLRRNRIDELGGGRHAKAVDIEQLLPRESQAVIDAKALVQIGVVDQPLPPTPRPRLLGVYAHYDQQRVAELISHLGNPLGVLQRG